MAIDPYRTLGVAKDATQDQIRSAYRKLAKKHHPDLNPGNKAAEEQFKAVSSANDLLSDPEKRAQYDRGEIDGAGEPRPEHAGYRRYAEAAAGGRYRQADDADMGDIFADLFSHAREQNSRPRRGRDQVYALTVDFVDAINGAQKRLTLPDGRTLDVRVPPGFEDGQTLRLRGQGGEGANGGPAGDALIEVRVHPHRLFRREGDDIHLELPITLKEAVLGGKVTVPTTTGAVAMTVPKRSDTGAVLRLRGRGVPAHAGRPAGDQRVTLKIVLGDADDALEAFLREWSPAHEINPRQGMTEAS